MNMSSFTPDRPAPHPIWDFCGTEPRRLKAASYRVKMLTGTYILQASLAKFNQEEVEPTCQLCGAEAEDTAHFLLRCSALEMTRHPENTKLSSTLQEMGDQPRGSIEEWCRMILNGVPSSPDALLGLGGCGVGTSSRRSCRWCRKSRTCRDCEKMLKYAQRLNHNCNILCIKLHEKRAGLLCLKDFTHHKSVTRWLYSEGEDTRQ